MHDTAIETDSRRADESNALPRPPASPRTDSPQSPVRERQQDQPQCGELSSAQWDKVGRIEVDRFCERCGYNLYTQAVVRHPELDMLLVRCPDCGHLHAAREHMSAASVWMRRLAAPAILLWIGAILFLTFMTFMGLMGMNIVTLEEATRWETVRTVGGNTTIYRSVQAEILNANFPDNPEDIIMVNSFRALCAALGFAFAVFLTLSFPHWRRWGYFAAVILVAALPSVFVYYYLRSEVAQGGAHGMYLSLVYAGCFGIAGIVGGLTGRIIGRGFVRLVLPPKLRTPFTYLWTTDGKLPPAVSGAATDRSDHSSTTGMQ